MTFGAISRASNFFAAGFPILNDIMTQYRKKLIEVALPLEDINREAAREKGKR